MDQAKNPPTPADHEIVKVVFGTKLNEGEFSVELGTPDTPAFDVSLASSGKTNQVSECPGIPPAEKFTGPCFISQFERELFFCCDFEGREAFNAQLDEAVKRENRPVSQPFQDQYCCVMQEGLYYRAKVVQLQPLEVLFIDHGNYATVANGEIHALPEGFNRAPFATASEIDKVFDFNRVTIREWEDNEKPQIDIVKWVFETAEFTVSGQPALEFFQTKTTIKEPKLVDKVQNSYKQYNIGATYDFTIVAVTCADWASDDSEGFDVELCGYMQQDEKCLEKISTTFKEDEKARFYI